MTAFTLTERRLIRRLRTPSHVQRFLNRLPYNTETHGETLRSFRQVVRHGRAHCAEATLFAACVLEQHGYPPLVLSIESADYLDHVLFLFRHRGRWGTVAKSRDPGLFGRKPVFRSIGALARSYIDEYIDANACVQAFGKFDLRTLHRSDWRFSKQNVWALHNALCGLQHKSIKVPRERLRRMRERYIAFQKNHGDKKPLFYRGRKNWSEIPREFL